MTSRHVLIIGGGFGGLTCARALDDAAVRVTLLDRRNHHLFQPLLYQVATAALNPSAIAIPIRRVFRSQKNCTVLLGEAADVDTARKVVRLTDGELEYDDLVIATGATHSYFGKDHWAKHAPGLKSLEDALEIRRRILLAYEAAERETDPARRRALMTFVVIGAGPTGVELAGALAEIARQSLYHDFRSIDPSSARVLLLEGAPRVLPPLMPESSASAADQLRELGVEVRTGALVTELDEHGVTVGGERIEARTVLWAAGVAANPLARSLNVPLDRAGRAIVGADCTVPGQPDVYVIGDLASFTQDGKPLPGVAPVAIQMGNYVADSILRKCRREAPKPFRYLDKGSMATIGRAAAVAEVAGRPLSGLIAWAAWLFIHIVFLIGFRNRVLVLLEWAFQYLAFERGARLITGHQGPVLEPREAKR